MYFSHFLNKVRNHKQGIIMANSNQLIFTANDSYLTPANTRVSFWAKLFPGITIYFYLKTIDIVIKASNLARRGHFSNLDWAQSSAGIVKNLERVGIKLSFTGKKHFLSIDGPVIFIGNHMSVLETFVLPVLIAPFKPVTFVVKRSLVDYPIFKHIMRSRDPIVVGRENPRQDFTTVITEGEKRLGAGISVVVFPQSTRMVEFDPKRFNTIGIKLAKRTGVPIIPMAIKSDAWGNGRLLKDFGVIDAGKRVHIDFGPPILIEGRGNESHAKVVNFIEARFESWRTATPG